MLEIGDVFRGQYQVLARLGEGSAAVVYRARDLELDREVGLKLLKPSLVLGDPARLAQEAKLLGSLQHPHVLQIFDAGQDGEVFYLVLELAEGGSLAARIPPEGLEAEVAARIAREVLEAIGAAHAAGILHRDIKPCNVLLDREGGAKLADFGLAKAATGGVRTRTGVILGTPEFMAPELFQGRAAGRASDLYSWGCLVYQLANGQPPHTGSMADIARARVAGGYRPGREQGPLGQAIAGALRRDPAQRATVEALREALEGTRRLEGTRGPDASPLPSAGPAGAREAPTRVTRAGNGSPGRRRALGVGLGVAALVAGGFVLSPGRDPAPVLEPAREAGEEDPVTRWEHRLGGIYPGIVIGRLQAATYPSSDDTLGAMLRTRRGEPPAGVDRGALEGLRAGLPYLEELQAALPDLEAALVDTARDFAARSRLFQALQRLDSIDGYFEAWGLGAPYGVASRLRRFVPVSLRAHEPARLAREDAPLGRDPGEGRHCIFRWRNTWDKTFP